MLSFLFDAALAKYPIVADKLKRKENIRLFLHAFHHGHQSTSPDLPAKPQFSDSNYIARFRELCEARKGGEA